MGGSGENDYRMPNKFSEKQCIWKIPEKMTIICPNKFSGSRCTWAIPEKTIIVYRTNSPKNSVHD